MSDQPVQHADEVRLRGLLTEVVVAADRLMGQWAEADIKVRNSLWKALGLAVQRAEDEVYPLASEDGAALMAHCHKHAYNVPHCARCSGAVTNALRRLNDGLIAEGDADAGR
jgi:hypothetical protein